MMKDRAFVLRIVVVYSPVECERRTRMAKRYEELTISDDFMFGKAMGDKVASRSGWICIRGIKSECTMQSCRTRESAGESVGVI
jgi:hypothetical protein